ncbi:hypothetical protein JF50_23615 [Pseudoalteromonas luteoviolacea]|uniref:Haem-binding uptake Tiki superfamily ChaN domain-containing protein n=1 Tax=Pseudoalteromonas luteoviolacea TaxID=43657 RepID=A0A0C1Q5Q2_9GAMM|nr:DUF5694 domain-containing protein [Pseudoalteromonas luteoviolacea]KID54850.1 hypothetical protein JF50_23615 [Pseudoalteromonas luteoviolacea]
MKKITLCIIALLQSFSIMAKEPTQPDPAQLMLMGVFHFANPQADTVKTKQINVMTPENQSYLEALAKRISDFKPTVVLLEYNKKYQEQTQQEYTQYLQGQFTLKSNEIYQLGFRVAKHAGLSHVYLYDEQEIHWQSKPLFEYMAQHDANTQKRFGAFIAQLTQKMEHNQMTKSLKELLLISNSTEWDNLNKSLYFKTNHVGAGKGFEGADAAASWWHRNFRMYANIQQYAQPGERVLVIGGQGHTSIFKDFLKLDAERQAVDVTEYIK